MIFNIDIGIKNVTPSLNKSYPADVTVIAGTNASFTVFVTDEGFPKDHVLQWFVNGVAVKGATEASYVRDTSGDKGQLSVWCEVTNKAGTTTSRRATLTVKKVPVLNAPYPLDVTGYVGDTVTFLASIYGHGYPTNYSYQWYVDGVAVAGATGQSYTTVKTVEGPATIHCVVTNEAGSVKTRTATLTANRIYLYKNGDTCNAVTGGWVAARSSSSSDSYAKGLTLNATNMTLISRANEYDAGCGTVLSIDLSKQSRLNAVVSCDDNTGLSFMGVSSQLNEMNLYTKAATTLPTEKKTVSLDIRDVDSGHIVFKVNGTATRTAVIDSVWLG